MNHRSARVGRSVRAAGLVALGAVLAGCGTAPSSLRPMAQPTSLQLQTPVKWPLRRLFHDYEGTLIAGRYVAVGESDEGTYFVGPKPCLIETPVFKDKDRPKDMAALARDCGIFKPRKASEPPTVFFVQNGFWMVTDFAADGTARLDTLKDHRDLGGQPDAAPRPSVLDANGPDVAVAKVAAGNHGPLVAGAGAGIGTGLVAGFIAADIGTYHDVDMQPPSGWLNAALAPKAAD